MTKPSTPTPAPQAIESTLYDAHIVKITRENMSLRKELAAMTEDRNLWRDEHNGDCPNIAALEAEREARKKAEEKGWNDAIEAAAETLIRWEYYGGGYDRESWEEIRALAKPASGIREKDGR